MMDIIDLWTKYQPPLRAIVLSLEGLAASRCRQRQQLTQSPESESTFRWLPRISASLQARLRYAETLAH
jgi:hypothetical protein